MSNNKLDKFLYKIISRKLMVFIASTVFLSLNMITGEQWLVISTAYISLQTFSDTLVKIKGTFESKEVVQTAQKVLAELKELKDKTDD